MAYLPKKNKDFLLKTINSINLKVNDINDICLLKDKEWKYGVKSQKKWFKSNVKPYDIHNLFYIQKKLVGYTLLRKRTFQNKKNSNASYLLLDTLIIDNKYRGLKLSDFIMLYNNLTIKQSKLFSLLFCNNRLVKYYENFSWQKLNEYIIADCSKPSNVMVFNKTRLKEKSIFYINK